MAPHQQQFGVAFTMLHSSEHVHFLHSVGGMPQTPRAESNAHGFAINFNDNLESSSEIVYLQTSFRI